MRGALGATVAVLATAAAVAVAAPARAIPVDTGRVDVGPAGTSLMHGDLASTDSTPNVGPGRRARVAASTVPGGACAATFIGSDGIPVSLCTQFLGPGGVAVPTVTLFHPRTASVLARLPLTKGGLLGGVYGYLDARDRVVVADGSGAIVRVAHRGGLVAPRLVVEERVSLAGHLPRGDAVTGLSPDYAGRVWFASTNGVIGTVTRVAGRSRVTSMHLPRGEQLGNGLSVRPAGVSVLTTHALYEMTAGADGIPRVRWRRGYDRGAARKPGQLTWGSGTTPTYFGPRGDDWVAIVDSADRAPNLLVYRSDDGGLVCRMRAFGRSGQGTENSVIARGPTSLVIPSTYGYQYPPMAESGPARPSSAPFVGGSTRVDVAPGRCHRVWENGDRIASLPRLSRADGLVYALGYGPYRPGPQQLGPVYLIGSDSATGRRVVTIPVGTGPVDEPLELTGTIARDGTLWQATVGRMLRIARG